MKSCGSPGTGPVRRAGPSTDDRVAAAGRVPPGPLAERDALVPQTDAEHGDRRRGEHGGAQSEVARLGRVPGSGRDHDIVESREVCPEIGKGADRVVEDDDRFLAVDLGDQLEQVVRVRVVIVDEQGLHPPTSLGSFRTYAVRLLCRPRRAWSGGYSHFLKKR